MSNNRDNREETVNIIPITGAAGRANAALKGRTQRITGIVGTVMPMDEFNAVAFSVRNGGRDVLFWMSTERQERDGDYRVPLAGESVKIWFNDQAKSLSVFGEKALGVIEIQNISNDSEKAAFAWFAAQRKDPAPK